MTLSKETVFRIMTEELIHRLKSSEKDFLAITSMYVVILSEENILHFERSEFMKRLKMYYEKIELIVVDFKQIVPLGGFSLPEIPPHYQLEGMKFEHMMTLYLETLFLSIESFEKMLNNYYKRSQI